MKRYAALCGLALALTFTVTGCTTTAKPGVTPGPTGTVTPSPTNTADATRYGVERTRTGEAVRDVGRGVGNAGRDIVGGTGRAVEDIGAGVRNAVS